MRRELLLLEGILPCRLDPVSAQIGEQILVQLCSERAVNSSYHWTAEHLNGLMSIPGIGARRALKLAHAFPDWDALAASTPDQLRALAGGPAAALSDHLQPQVPLPDGGAQVLGFFDPSYPAGLRDLPDPPPLIWVHGRLPRLPGVAVVGTRHPTASGITAARAMTEVVIEAGGTVVSGLAVGIDTIAHRTCVQAGHPTVAVLGSGVDPVFPRQNRGLAAEILDTGGALISEQLPGTGPTVWTLVARDRIQAALSDVVVVVQSGLDSGTLHTARATIELGRWLAVLAVPPGEGAGPEFAGNAALTDPAGCDPNVLHATARVAAAIRARRPVADTVLRSPDDLRTVMAGSWFAAERGSSRTSRVRRDRAR